MLKLSKRRIFLENAIDILLKRKNELKIFYPKEFKEIVNNMEIIKQHLKEGKEKIARLKEKSAEIDKNIEDLKKYLGNFQCSLIDIYELILNSKILMEIMKTEFPQFILESEEEARESISLSEIDMLEKIESDLDIKRFLENLIDIENDYIKRLELIS